MRKEFPKVFSVCGSITTRTVRNIAPNWCQHIQRHIADFFWWGRPLWEKLLILRDSPLSVPQVWHSKIYKRKPNRTQSALKWIRIKNIELAYSLISQLRPYFQRWPDLTEEEKKWRYKKDRIWAMWAHLPRTRYRSLGVGLGPEW